MKSRSASSIGFASATPSVRALPSRSSDHTLCGVYLRADQIRDVKRAAKARGISRSELVRIAIDRLLVPANLGEAMPNVNIAPASDLTAHF